MSIRNLFLTLCVSVLILPVWSWASTACDEPTSEQISQALTAKRQDYESQLTSLEKDMRAHEVTFRQCSSQKWRVFWQPRLAEAEAAHEKLRKQRSELVKLRQAIESDPGPVKVFQYCPRMEQEVFYGYEEYFTGIKSYLAFINASTDLCKNRDYSEGSIELALTYVTQILDAVSKITDIFKKA